MRNFFLEILIKILMSLKLKLRFTFIFLILYRKTPARLALAPLIFKGVAKVGYANDFSKILTLEIRVACNSEQPFFCFFLLFQKNFVSLHRILTVGGDV